MIRSNHARNRAEAKAFDFDVVTDVPPPPVRRPPASETPPKPVPEDVKTVEL